MMIKEKINEIKSLYDVNCIIQIGNISGNDIDLMVIVEDDLKYLREIVGLFDVSYISIKQLKREIQKKSNFLVTSLTSFKVLYQKNNEVISILEKIKDMKSPKLNRLDIDYHCFTLYQQLVAIEKRLIDTSNALFLMNNLLKEGLVFYLRKMGFFVPKDKKILDLIKKDNDHLYQMSISFINESNIEKRFNLIKNIIDEVLKPYGVLKEWKKGPFPLK